MNIFGYETAGNIPQIIIGKVQRGQVQQVVKGATIDGFDAIVGKVPVRRVNTEVSTCLISPLPWEENPSRTH